MKLNKILVVIACLCLLCGCTATTGPTKENSATTTTEKTTVHTTALLTKSSPTTKKQSTTKSTSAKKSSSMSHSSTTTSQASTAVANSSVPTTSRPETKTTETSRDRSLEIAEENALHEKRINEIQSTYSGKIAAQQSLIDTYKTNFSAYYPASYYSEQYDALMKEINQKERKLQLLKMSSGSSTQIQRLEHEIADMRQSAAKCAQQKFAAQEIEGCEQIIETYQAEMDRLIEEENDRHQTELYLLMYN